MTLPPLPDALRTIATRPLFAMEVAVTPPYTPGGPDGAQTRVGDVPGGRFEGERLSGTILPGSDWQTLRSDGATLLDARIVLRTEEDEALIAMTSTGIRQGEPDVMARLGRGEPVDPSEYYFRIVAH